MNYKNIREGIFLSRPNRFIAQVKVDGTEITCHVKNTGRCRELLIPGVVVILEYFPEAASAGRKTAYDLIAVYKNKMLINMDSQAPNKAAWEWLCKLEQAHDGCSDAATDSGCADAALSSERQDCLFYTSRCV